MTTTNLRNEREVDRVADHFVLAIAGIELLCQSETFEYVESDDLANPARDWVRQCPRAFAITKCLVRRRGVDSIGGVALVLPSHELGADSFLVTDSSDDYARLCVTQGLESTHRVVCCPTIISEMFNLAMDF